MIEVGDTEDKREIIIKYFKSERRSLKARRMVNLLRWKDYELRERIPSFNFQEMTKTLPQGHPMTQCADHLLPPETLLLSTLSCVRSSVSLWV